MRFLRIIVSVLSGSALLVSAFVVWFAAYDMISPQPPVSGMPGDPTVFVRTRNLLGDGDTIIALLIFGAATGVIYLSVHKLALSHIRRSREAKGLCAKCGYDLRGSTKACPECGTPISIPSSR